MSPERFVKGESERTYLLALTKRGVYHYFPANDGRKKGLTDMSKTWQRLRKRKSRQHPQKSQNWQKLESLPRRRVTIFMPSSSAEHPTRPRAQLQSL